MYDVLGRTVTPPVSYRRKDDASPTGSFLLFILTKIKIKIEEWKEKCDSIIDVDFTYSQIAGDRYTGGSPWWCPCSFQPVAWLAGWSMHHCECECLR